MSNRSDMRVAASRRLVKSLRLLLLLLFLACHDDEYLDGFDIAQLFAAPSQEELDAIKLEWQFRNLPPDAYTVEQLVDVTPSGIILKIISYNVDGTRRYAALLVPPSDVTLPVRMFINGFDIDNTTGAIKLEIDDTFLDKPFIFAMPVLRGQSLQITLNGDVYSSPLSEGDHCDAFDGAADDVIAMLNIIEHTEEGNHIELNDTILLVKPSPAPSGEGAG